MSDDAVQHAIRELVLANRILAREDVIDDFGHVSLRHPTDPGRYFLSRSRSPVAVTADDIMEFTLDGTPVDQRGRRMYAERAIHGTIYMARPEVTAVTHHHARSVIPFTVLPDLEMKPIFHMGSVIGPHVPMWDSQPEFGDTNMLVDDLPKGHSLARALGGARCVLLRGHGATCVGRSMLPMSKMRTPRNRSGLAAADTPPGPQSTRPRVSSTDMKSRLPRTLTSPWPPGHTSVERSTGLAGSATSHTCTPL